MKKVWRSILILALLAAAGWGLYAAVDWPAIARADSEVDASYTVIRRTIEDRVVERGTVESQNTVYGKCELPGWQNKIVSIVPEGKTVRKGDVVVKLETEEVNQQIAAKKVALNEARGTLEQARQERDIQINKGQTDIATAELEWELAKLDLTKYEQGDFVAEQADQERAIKEAEAALEKAREDLKNMEVLVRKGYRELAQLRELELRVDGWAFQVHRDQQRLHVLREFDFKRKITEFRAKAEESERKVERAKTTAAAEQLKADAAVANAENAVALHESELKALEDILAKCTIIAPQDGTVAYANQRWMDPSERIREGTSVHSQQDIFYLPDMANMQVKATVHESVVDRIHEGLQATIRLDAFSETKLAGEVTYVSELPASSYSDAKNYDATIVIKQIPPGLALKPGMTAEVNIHVGTYANVIAVPVGAITEHFGRSFVYVLGGEAERRSVTTGRMTHAFVEVTEGLEEGEVVALDAYQRGLADFSRSDEESQLGEETSGSENSPGDDPGGQPPETA